MDTAILYSIGFILAFAGILIIMLALLLLFFSGAEKESKLKGGIIIIGPFPIILGTDKESTKTILMLSIVLMVLAIVLIVTMHFTSR